MYIIRNRIFYLDCFTASQFAMTGKLDCHAAIAARNDEVRQKNRTRHCEGCKPEAIQERKK
jgi:hypothetical protein